MSSEFDPAEFVDNDFAASPKATYSAGSSNSHASSVGRPPTREENDVRVTEMKNRLSELRRAQEELEREKSSLEETRRKQMELDNGRKEMMEHLTRGVALLEETSFEKRRESEHMIKSLHEMKVALGKIQEIDEKLWTPEDHAVQLTRALTVLENARMEWNSARLKFDVLNRRDVGASAPLGTMADASNPTLLSGQLSFAQQCRLGLALTWPIVLAVILVGILFIVAR